MSNAAEVQQFCMRLLRSQQHYRDRTSRFNESLKDEDTQDMSEYCYSIDEEYFRSELGEVICDLDDGENSYYRGVPVPRKHSDYLNVDRIIEDMQEAAYESMPEDLAADYLVDDLSDDKLKELDTLITNWFNDNAPQPTFYHVEEIEEITVFIKGGEIVEPPTS